MAIDYTLPNPANAITGGLRTGLALNQMRQQTLDAERSAAAKAQMSADIQRILTNRAPSAKDYADLITKYPQFNEQFEQAWGMLNQEQQGSRMRQASDVYAALEAGSPEIAQDLLSVQAEAFENVGDVNSAKAARTLVDVIGVNPDTAKTSVALRLASMMGPEKFTETFTKLQTERRDAALAPSELTEAQAKARKAAVDAQFAESEAALDLQKKGWDITKIQEDVQIAKENSRIAAMRAQLDREQNELKRQELQQKLADAERKRDETIRTKVADVESARMNIDNMLNTADRIINTPIGVVEDATGPISSRLPTLSQDTADFEALIENFDAQAFLAQIPNIKGMGALSDAEGKKLAAALQSFSLKQSPQRLLENVREAQRLLLKARSNVAGRHGVPETIPDTPAVESSPEDIDAILQKYGVQ